MPSKSFYIGVAREHDRLPTLFSLFQALEGVEGGRRVLICCSTRDSLEELSAGLQTMHNVWVGTLTADSLEPEREAVLSDFAADSLPRNPAQTAGGHPSTSSTGGGLASPIGRVQGRYESDKSGASDAAIQGASQGYYSPRGAWHPIYEEEVLEQQQREAEAARSLRRVLVTTDSALKGVGGPVRASLLLHYDSPLKKEHYSRRLAAVTVSSSSAGASGGGGGEAGNGGTGPTGGWHWHCVSVHFVVGGCVQLFRSVEMWAPHTRIEPLPIRAVEMFSGEEAGR